MVVIGSKLELFEFIMTKYICLLILTVVCSLKISSATASGKSITQKAYKRVDEESGMIIAPNWELVKYQCSVCHSITVVIKNSGNKKEWEETIKWMIATQGAWDLSDAWEPILGYLSSNYNSNIYDMSKFRRKPINNSFISHEGVIKDEE